MQHTQAFPSDVVRNVALAGLRERAKTLSTEPGPHLVWEQEILRVIPVKDGKPFRLDRSLAADILLDDATVSRRHALLIRNGDSVKVLDDRSLNGTFVNGQRIESCLLRDGDELVIGRYRLYFLQMPAA
jgi:pSer/pThr/pTyr-binding forkhead associated (FHA) protein